jgi:hypothetical protein
LPLWKTHPRKLDTFPVKYQRMRCPTLSTVLLSITLLINCSLSLAATKRPGTLPANDGSVILRMCKGADKVKALSTMCHSYLNGYIDAAHYFGKGKTPFCLVAGDKEKLPTTLVSWIASHPEALHQPAGAVLQQALTEHFPCHGKR